MGRLDVSATAFATAFWWRDTTGLHVTVCTSHSTIHTLHSFVHILYLTLHTPHFTPHKSNISRLPSLKMSSFAAFVIGKDLVTDPVSKRCLALEKVTSGTWSPTVKVTWRLCHRYVVRDGGCFVFNPRCPIAHRKSVISFLTHQFPAAFASYSRLHPKHYVFSEAVFFHVHSCGSIRVERGGTCSLLKERKVNPTRIVWQITFCLCGGWF
jgi:hypothetical protein